MELDASAPGSHWLGSRRITVGYDQYQLRRDRDGWHIHSPFLPIEIQLMAFRTRKRAITIILHVCSEHRSYV